MPCTDFSCARCLHRSFQEELRLAASTTVFCIDSDSEINITVDDSDGELSPTQTWIPARAPTTPPPPAAAGGLMPEHAGCIEKENEGEVIIDEDILNEMDHQSENPRTPKRAAAATSSPQGGPASPPKLLRHVEPEPSNRDLLLFMQQMRSSQEAQMTKLYDRMDLAERKMNHMEEETRTRMSAMEAKLEGIELSDLGADKVAREQITRLESTVREQLTGM